MRFLLITDIDINFDFKNQAKLPFNKLASKEGIGFIVIVLQVTTKLDWRPLPQVQKIAIRFCLKYLKIFSC